MRAATGKRLQKGFWIVLFLALALFILFRIIVPPRREVPPQSVAALRAEKGIPVRTSPARLMPWRLWKSAYGKVRSAADQGVSSFVREVIAAVFVDVGDAVAPGQLLLELSRETHSAALAARGAEFREAERDYARKKALFEAGGISRKELEGAAVVLESRRSDLAEIRSNLARTQVRAEIGGVVTFRDAEVGEVAEAGRLLLNIADLERIEVEALVSPLDLDSLASGTKARLFVNGVPAEGLVKRIDPVADSATGLYRVVVTFENPTALKLGAYVEVHFLIADREAVVVPYEAIRRESGKTYLFIVSGDVAQRRDLSLGAAQDGFVEVPSGLAPGERVIVEGIDSVYDGARIRPDGFGADPTE